MQIGTFSFCFNQYFSMNLYNSNNTVYPYLKLEMNSDKFSPIPDKPIR